MCVVYVCQRLSKLSPLRTTQNSEGMLLFVVHTYTHNVIDTRARELGRLHSQLLKWHSPNIGGMSRIPSNVFLSIEVTCLSINYLF